MVKFAVSFITGIAAFNVLPFFPVSISILCILSVLHLFSVPLLPPLIPPLGTRDTEGLTCCRKDLNSKILIVFTFIFGVLFTAARQEGLPELTLPDHEVIIEGTIIDVPERSEDKIRFTLDQVYLDKKKIQGKVRLVLLKKFFQEKITEHLLAPGDRISAGARVREPNTFRNPGVYPYDMKKDGIVATGYIKQMRITGRSRGLLVQVHKQRQILGLLIDNSLSEENASLHKAIIPGLKGDISQDMKDAFGSTGLAHLLSISGTHFGLLAFIVFRFVRLLVTSMPGTVLTRMTLYLTPSQISVLSTMPVLVLYALISGARTPTVRSLIMVSIYLLALFLGRKGQWINSLSIAAAIILLWHPDALFTLSFQLSFLAVLSIGYVLEHGSQNRESRKQTGDFKSSLPAFNPSLSPIRKRGIERDGGWIKKAFDKVKTAMLITVAALLGTTPIVAVYFHQFPLISPLTNLIITPLVCFSVLPLGLFAGFASLVFGMNIMPLSGLTDALTHFLLNLIQLFSHVPYAHIHIHRPSAVLTGLYYLSLLLVMKSKSRWKLIPLILVICLYMIQPHLNTSDLRITFLDVGQGDASLITLPDRKVMIIDGGPNEPDTGRLVTAPYLWAKGIKKVDYLVLSHPHPDHYGGLIYIMNNFDIREVWLNGRFISEARQLFQHIEKNNIPFRILRRGDVFEAEKYSIYVFHPYDEFYAYSQRGIFSSQNSDSLVLKIESDHMSILFTGDVEIESEENLVHLGTWLRSDIIKVPHHGGRTSSSREFIESVSPELAVISAGRNNPFGHPHKDTLTRYEDAGVKLLRTDRSGAVTITSRDNYYEITTYSDSQFKKVTSWQDELRNLKLLF